MDEEALGRWRQALERAKKAIEEGKGRDPEAVRALAEKLGGIQGALQRLSSASVSRVTLSQAVKDSLKQILEEDGELLPELDRLRAELERARGETREVRQIHGEIVELTDDVRRDSGQTGAFAEALRGLDQKLDDLSGSVRAAAASSRRGLVESIETRVRAAIESLTSGARHATGRIEKELAEFRDEQSAASGELTERLATFDERASTLDRRLAAVEGAIGAVHDRIDELRSSASLHAAPPEPPDDGRRVLEGRLVEVRDALRAQLAESETGWRGKPGFWERLSGRPPRETRLSRAEWEGHRSALEAALDALEAIICNAAAAGPPGVNRSRAAPGGRSSRNSAST